MKKKFFKKGEYIPAVIDPNDPEVKRLLALTKKLQEKNELLKKIDPKIGDLIIG